MARRRPARPDEFTFAKTAKYKYKVTSLSNQRCVFVFVRLILVEGADLRAMLCFIKLFAIFISFYLIIKIDWANNMLNFEAKNYWIV